MAMLYNEHEVNEKRSVILVVDDEETNRRLMEAMLVPLGYDLLFAGNGAEALDLVRQNSPDLVLMDVMMPVMDGYQATRSLKESESTRHIPVIMVTALRDLEDRVKSLEAGVDDFLSKPVEKNELSARVRSLLKVKAYNDHMRDYQAMLENEVAQRTLELKAAFVRIRDASLETIFRLSRAAEYKDENTGGHIQRMSNYAAAIARTMGFKGREAENLLYAASMHDIGKIGIPDSILTKPGSLTEDEFRIMKMHPEIGGEILEGASGFLRMGEIIARTHHERWDGSGYPHGLAGREIPLMSRIVMVADVFDALISRRPYKQPFGIDDSLDIIRSGQGYQFDPAVVDAFFESLDEIKAIGDRYQDVEEGEIRLYAMLRHIEQK